MQFPAGRFFPSPLSWCESFGLGGVNESRLHSTVGGITGNAQQSFADALGGLKDFAGDVRASWGEWPGNGSLEANLAAVPFIPIVGIEAAAARGVSVLGRYPAYLQLGESIPSRVFSIPAWIWNRMSPTQHWAANTRFLGDFTRRRSFASDECG